MRFFIFLSLLTPLMLFAAYSNCDFKIKPYETICKKAVKLGASVEYANLFLLAPHTKQRDIKSLKLLAPDMIKTHRRNEKRANNDLLTFVPNIVSHLRKYAKTYDEAQRRFHVNREVIAAILAKETRLGSYALRHDAFTVFNTIARELKPDSRRNRRLIALSYRNIAAMIHHCDTSKIKISHCRFESSYAGAIGIPQFLPQNFKYVTGFQRQPGNLTRMEDAILSAARYLNEHSGFATLIDWKKFPDMNSVENAWYDFDLIHDNASFAYAKGKKTKQTYTCYACEKPSLRYMIPFVKAVMDYNQSSNYAIGVLRLAYDAHKILSKDMH